MKLIVQRFTYEPPRLTIVPETEYEAAVLGRYWEGAKLDTGKARGEDQSFNGLTYSIKFKEPT